MIAVSVILEKLEKCYLPRLSQNLEQCENHSEFENWDKNLIENFPAVINLLNDLNLEQCSSPPAVLSSLLLLYFQLHTEGRWKSAKCEEFAQKLNYHFQLLYDTNLSNLLKNRKVYDTQEVFDKSIEILHQKLSPEDFKKYPALIEAYYSIVKDVKAYEIVVKTASVMPVTLLLIEDYLNENRLKGLKCFSSIIKCLTTEHFEGGNYYEVMYRALKKIIIEKDLELTKLVLECLSDLLQILPPHVKVSTIDETLEIVLDQLYTESNLYRKKEFFQFINRIIHSHGVHCVKRNMFLPVICDNLDICSNEAVRQILLLDTLECLQNWIIYCWCVWKLSQNHKLLSVLIKMLYITREDDSVATKIQNIFITLCKLSTEEEKREISENVEKALQEPLLLNEAFSKRLNVIKTSIC